MLGLLKQVEKMNSTVGNNATEHPEVAATLEMFLPKSVRRERRKTSNSLLYKKFQIERSEIFDNYFMNEDTIALANIDDDNLFLDTSTNPLRFIEKKKIDHKKNLYITPTFWSRGAGEKMRKYEGPIGFRTWPDQNTIRIVNSTHKNQNGTDITEIWGL